MFNSGGDQPQRCRPYCRGEKANRWMCKLSHHASRAGHADAKMLAVKVEVSIKHVQDLTDWSLGQ